MLFVRSFRNFFFVWSFFTAFIFLFVHLLFIFFVWCFRSLFYVRLIFFLVFFRSLFWIILKLFYLFDFFYLSSSFTPFLSITCNGVFLLSFVSSPIPPPPLLHSARPSHDYHLNLFLNFPFFFFHHSFKNSFLVHFPAHVACHSRCTRHGAGCRQIPTKWEQSINHADCFPDTL